MDQSISSTDLEESFSSSVEEGRKRLPPASRSRLSTFVIDLAVYS
jgi:hypothetical protein